MSALVEELTSRWRTMFSALARGEDLPPSTRLRAEGMMEAVVLLGVESAGGLQSRLGKCYLEAFGRSLEEDFGADWASFYPFPQIPAVTGRAPVYPSTQE